ncbi:MAG: argininosuccinate lyase [Sutterella sp.]|nr:argininosuccinate lyase [Sutterella sp.]
MSESVQRGKIKKAPADEVVKYLIRPSILGDLARSYNTILDINKAHVVMLAQTGIITRDVAKKILVATAQIESEKDSPTFEINPNVEDLYFNLERYLIQLTGMEVGGQQHTARSRNDLFATEIRMDARKVYLKLSQMFIDLRRAYLDQAKAHLDTVMSGYTHMQPSEPITFAHYLSGVLGAFGRDYDRFSRVWESLNLCPLGGGSMGSTSFPIDRLYTSNLLGFDGPIQNSLDCTASRDFVLEMVMTLAQTACTMSRTALDLYNWSTPEYGYIEVDDSCAVCSSIMPQKKNPFTLEHVKAKAAHMEGFVIGVYNAMKNVIFSHCRDTSVETPRYFYTALSEMEADLALLTVTVKTLSVKKDRMLDAARRNFCTVTELANYLVRHDGIAFREAHEIIAHVVGELTEKRLTSAEIDRDIVNRACQSLFGFETTLTEALVQEALDPRRVVEDKRTLGGTHPEEVARQLALIESQIKSDEAILHARSLQLQKANQLLAEAVAELSK